MRRFSLAVLALSGGGCASAGPAEPAAVAPAPAPPAATMPAATTASMAAPIAAPTTPPPAPPSETSLGSSAEPQGVETAPLLAAAAPATAEPAPPSLPVQCEQRGELCVPPADFVYRLCRGAFPGLALALFQKDSHWTRGYFTIGLMDPVNTLGGPSSEAQLAKGEELIILQKRGDGGGAGGMQMSGLGGYFVLRWDGTCATLMDGEVALKPTASLKSAPVPWKYVDDNVQQALLEKPEIRSAREQQRKACRGVALGARGKACQRATKDLNDQIVLAVRGGLVLPVPSHLP